MKGFIKRNRSKIFAAFVSASVLVMSVTNVFASEATPTSMIDTATLQIVEDFAADTKPTVLAILAVIVPAGLTLFAIGLGVKKGINYLQRKASRAI